MLQEQASPYNHVPRVIICIFAHAGHQFGAETGPTGTGWMPYEPMSTDDSGRWKVPTQSPRTSVIHCPKNKPTGTGVCGGRQTGSKIVNKKRQSKQKQARQCSTNTQIGHRRVRTGDKESSTGWTSLIFWLFVARDCRIQTNVYLSAVRPCRDDAGSVQNFVEVVYH